MSPAVPAIAALPNPDWWGEKPLLDRITIREIPRENQVKAYAEAEIDAIGDDMDLRHRHRDAAAEAGDEGGHQDRSQAHHRAGGVRPKAF